MKIRYYLRGLGLGILFAAVFFLAGGNSKQTMSDEMIKERAKELGMVENTVLADLGNTEEESVEASETEEESVGGSVIILETEEPTETETEETSEEETTDEGVILVARPISEGGAEEVITVKETVAEETSEEETTVEETVEETTEPEEETKKPVTDKECTIVVNKGDGSDTVSRKLFEAGLVENAYEYDQYLIQNGYDRKLSIGEHLIPAGASWEEMAKILCR